VTLARVPHLVSVRDSGGTLLYGETDQRRFGYKLVTTRARSARDGRSAGIATASRSGRLGAALNFEVVATSERPEKVCPPACGHGAASNTEA